MKSSCYPTPNESESGFAVNQTQEVVNTPVRSMTMLSRQDKLRRPSVGMERPPKAPKTRAPVTVTNVSQVLATTSGDEQDFCPSDLAMDNRN